jgi:hypothetical protein
MDHQDTINAIYSKNTKVLFKSFLILMEDLQQDHLINFEKLRNALPEKYSSLIEQADYFDQHKMQYLRKKILDMGNESIREAEHNLEDFTISFKF